MEGALSDKAQRCISGQPVAMYSTPSPYRAQRTLLPVKPCTMHFELESTARLRMVLAYPLVDAALMAAVAGALLAILVAATMLAPSGFGAWGLWCRKEESMWG